MKGAATITSAAAEKALKDAGFPMTSFAGGPPPTFAVVRAQLRTKGGEAPGADALASFAKELARELPDAAELFVEPDGRFTVEGKADVKLEAAALSSILAPRLEKSGLVLNGVEARTWPRTATVYLASLKTPIDAASEAKARAAIEGIDSVAAAFARSEGPWLVVTKEPCANVEARLRSVLSPLDVGIAEVRPR
jgi:hypothetical protein